MRLRTAVELLEATSDIEMQLEKVSFSRRKNYCMLITSVMHTFIFLFFSHLDKELLFLEVLQVSSPLLILHGAADKVTDPLVSQFLYEKASSKDKTLKLYEEGYHCILEGEPDDRIFTVLRDIIAWLDSHCSLNRGSLNIKVPSSGGENWFRFFIP